MKTLKYRQISAKTDEIRKIKNQFHGVTSWVRYIREGLGMTLEQLAVRTGLSTSTLSQLEKNEAENKVTIGSLKKAGAAMNCELIYALVPKESLESMREARALEKAKAFLAESHLQMEYEDQATGKKQQRAQLEELKEKIKTSRGLWDEI